MFLNMNERKKTYPLHKVIQYRNIQKLKILLPEVKDINEKNDKGYPILVLACEQDENDEMLEILMKRKDIDATLTNNEKFNALHTLAFRGKLVWLIRLLKNFPNIPIDALTDVGNNTLILASKMNHSDVIQYLYDKGANINLQNLKKFTALHYAANNGYIESTQKLVDLGATVNVKDDFGNTPLMKSSTWGFYETCKILVQHGAAAVNVINNISQTALTQAVRRQNYDVVKLLLENNADPNLHGPGSVQTLTPLARSCSNNNVEITKLLIQYGANVNFPRPYSLAVFLCAKCGSKECLEELLKMGVNVNGKNERGKTAAYVAKQNRHYSLIRMLQTY